MTKTACANVTCSPSLNRRLRPGTGNLRRPAPATAREPPITAGESMQTQPAKPPLYGISPRFYLPAAFFSVAPTPSQRPSPEGISRVSHCDTSWPASTDVTNVTMSHFCDTHSDTKSCHTVTLSGQLAQCHKCHTFQLQKSVFSYNRCDIVTSLPRTAPIPAHRRTL